MLPIITCIAATFALVASIYKERKTEAKTPEVIKAIRIHHLMQLSVILLALLSSIDAERISKQQHINQLENTASQAAAAKIQSILHVYFIELMSVRLTLINYLQFKNTEFSHNLSSPKWDDIVSTTLKKQRDEGLEAFKSLQKIAEGVLIEAAIYDTYYPQPLIIWARRTLELNEGNLEKILLEKDEGLAYADILGNAIGYSLGKANKAFSEENLE